MEEINALFHGFSVILTPMNMLLMMVGITLVVQGGFVAFFLYLRKRAKRIDPERRFRNFGFVAGPLHLIEEITNFGPSHRPLSWRWMPCLPTGIPVAATIIISERHDDGDV